MGEIGSGPGGRCPPGDRWRRLGAVATGNDGTGASGGGTTRAVGGGWGILAGGPVVQECTDNRGLRLEHGAGQWGLAVVVRLPRVGAPLEQDPDRGVVTVVGGQH